LFPTPDKTKDVPVAAPITGVVRVGDVAKTTFPVPVEDSHEATVPFE